MTDRAVVGELGGVPNGLNGVDACVDFGHCVWC